MINPHDIKNRITDVLKRRGPSLPIQIAKDIGMSSLFVSAFLSEMSDEKRLKISSLKVGGSPLYFLEGQEVRLENFYKFLHSKESEAYLLLKQNKILKDSEQEPAIRVALRAIKDFAFSFKNDEEIYWRYLTITEPEIIEIFKNQPKKQEQKIKEELLLKPASPDSQYSTTSSEIKIPEALQKIGPVLQEKPKRRISKQKQEKQEALPLAKLQEKPEFQNPLALKPIEKPKKEKPHSEFVINTILFLNKNNFRIIEEKKHKAKEFTCLLEINSDLGKILFYTQAKDKKAISDSDLKKLLSLAQSIPLPALFLYTGDLSKKAVEYEAKYSSILKTKKLE